MTPKQTSIHLALGESEDLNFEMIERAVTSGVREDQRLDWKKAAYQGAKARDEFAKDVAALANSQGGLIVIGVAEQRGTGAAESIHVFAAADDGLERTMRSWLHNAVTPMVPAVGFHALVRDDENDGVLVVSVPPSSVAPHLVGSDRSVGFPYRVGTQTMWMREPDIERAYRERFDRRHSDEEHLELIIDRAVRHLDMTEGPWIVVATRPTSLRPSGQPRPTKQEVVALLEASLRHRLALGVNEHFTNAVIRQLSSAALNPRPGLRSWVAAYRKQWRPTDKAIGTYVAIHDDGSLVLAAQARLWGQVEPDDATYAIHESDVAGAAVDHVSLVAAATEAFGLEGEHLGRVRLVRGDNRPYAYHAPERIGHITLGPSQVEWSLAIDDFEPSDIVIPPLTDRDVMRAAADEIARHIASQFGVDTVHIWTL